MLATPYGVHQPMCVVIVDNMEESPPASWHPLCQPLAEVVESNCYLHDCITGVTVACTKQHDLYNQHLEMVIAVDAMMASISPSAQFDMEI